MTHSHDNDLNSQRAGASPLRVEVGKQRQSLARARHLIDRWQELCGRYLPVAPEGSIWRYSRSPSADDPDQGWKLHISATILSANRVFERIAPMLAGAGVLFKATRSLEELNDINCGLHYGFSQVGKFVTVYTRDAEEARRLAREIHRTTCRLPGPVVPYDRHFRPGSRVSYRYGAYSEIESYQGDATPAGAIRDSAGRLVPDHRGPGSAVPEWANDLFLKTGEREAGKASNLLGTTFLAFEAMSQRGKGGTYKALDLSVLPARLCVLKEGRKDGETLWDGRDGHWRAQREATVLADLTRAGVNVPRVYATFRSGRSFFVALEFIEGASLSSLLKRKAGMTVAQAISYGIQLARLLDGIHSAGWVWRDCKPQNLICSRGGQLRPVDFEGACRVDEYDILPWNTAGYVPDEWVERPRAGSAVRQDLFALGVVLRELMTCRPAKGGEPPPPLKQSRRGVPPAVREVIAALLDNSDTERPDARQVATVLIESRQTPHTNELMLPLWRE